MQESNRKGHLAALLTILIWGTTFISTKVLLRSFAPVEILFIRFVIGYSVLWCVLPRRLKIKDRKQEWYFAAAGLCGVTLYYLLENIALTYTWAAYSNLTRKISSFGYPTIKTTRRTFFYGLLFMVPVLFMLDFEFRAERLFQAENLLNLLFLGFGASALCFVTWNFAVRVLGPVKTSVYIYMVPVITAVTSAVILKEKLTVLMLAGIILTLAGLFLSEDKKRYK